MKNRNSMFLKLYQIYLTSHFQNCIFANRRQTKHHRIISKKQKKILEILDNASAEIVYLPLNKN